ncbi:Nramp family divalent metal transporter [Paraburkholderia sp. CI2]|uniref:Nramp family divalent metal transporter n=1 Tax=unclassified Paraburkholderia TaxID=2615204 RepID=UPI0028892001|nr:Nramp family divalent metal transporter [Paraburkholderia sp. CI2]
MLPAARRLRWLRLPALRPVPHRFQRSSRWRSAEFLSLLASASSTSSTTLGILGATVMPHNLYLHSSIVQTRAVKRDPASIRSAIGMSRIDTIASLVIAALINMAILILAAAAFYATGHDQVTQIEDAYRLLAPIVGTGFAAFLFAITLLASGQSSTFTGTVAGQVIMEGFLKMKIPCWQRRFITRALALYPLIRMTSDRSLIGEFANTLPTRLLVWTLFVAISAANLWLVAQTVGLAG